MEFGLYENVPFIDYVKIKAVNFHTLIEMNHSPAHMKSVIDGYTRPQTDALRLGRAFHSSILTPEIFDDEFHTASTCGMLIKSGDRKGMECGKQGSWWNGEEWFCGTHKKSVEGCVQPENMVTDEERTKALMMREIVRRSEAGSILRCDGKAEVTIVFERNGVKCKCRIDWLTEDTITDLKKCQRTKLCSDRWIVKEIADRNYHQQMAFYYMAIFHHTGRTPRVSQLLFIEDDQPHDSTLMPLDIQSLQIGVSEVDDMLSKYKRSRDSGQWPGCFIEAFDDSGRLMHGGLPKYRRLQAIADGHADEGSWPEEELRGCDAPQSFALVGAEES